MAKKKGTKRAGKVAAEAKKPLALIADSRVYVGKARQDRTEAMAALSRAYASDPAFHHHRCWTCDAQIPYREPGHEGHEILPCLSCATPAERVALFEQFFHVGTIEDAIFARSLCRRKKGERPAPSGSGPFTLPWEGEGNWFELPLEELIRRRGPAVLSDPRVWWAIRHLSTWAKDPWKLKIEGSPAEAVRTLRDPREEVGSRHKWAKAKLQGIFRALAARPGNPAPRSFADARLLARHEAHLADGKTYSASVSALVRETRKSRDAVEQSIHRATKSLTNER